MRNFLSRVGVGSATVDTILSKSEFEPGERVRATVEIEGGGSEQTVDELELAVMARTGGEGGSTYVLDSWEVFDDFTVGTGESRSVEVDLTIPRWTPPTRDGVEVWIETGLDIDWAVDPSDTDRVEIVPDPFLGALLSAVEDLGFAYRKTNVEEAEWVDDRPYVQEFEFVPDADPYRRRLDELEIICILREDDLRVVAEIDRVDEAADRVDIDFDEQEIPMTFGRPDADEMRRRFKREIEQFA